jgi:hypothetical protein
MKNYIFWLTVLLFFTACTKNNETATTPLNEMLPADSSAVAKGSFINGPHGTVTGKATVVVNNGVYTLALEEVMISKGPDLHVYLSRELQPVNFIDLGKLKSTAGNQLYAISGKPDLAQYKYALIHCQQYNHLFGSAALQ